MKRNAYTHTHTHAMSLADSTRMSGEIHNSIERCTDWVLQLYYWNWMFSDYVGVNMCTYTYIYICTQAYICTSVFGTVHKMDSELRMWKDNDAPILWQDHWSMFEDFVKVVVQVTVAKWCLAAGEKTPSSYANPLKFTNEKRLACSYRPKQSSTCFLLCLGKTHCGKIPSCRFSAVSSHESHAIGLQRLKENIVKHPHRQ